MGERRIMIMISGKVRSLFWYLKRPKFYPQLVHVLSKKLSLKRSRLDDTREEATSWCAMRAIDTEAAIQKITGSRMPKPVEEKFSNIFAIAHRKAVECPVKMGGGGNIDLLYLLAEYSKARNIIETGVAYGWSSLALLLSLQSRNGSKLISTDMPYVKQDNDQYVGCVVPAEFKSTWRLLRYADRQALPRALKELDTIDMCHYDSDKSYDGRMWAYPLLWKSLRRGGFFISDDIGDNVAFRDFSNSVKGDPIVVKWKEKYIGILIK